MHAVLVSGVNNRICDDVMWIKLLLHNELENEFKAEAEEHVTVRGGGGGGIKWETWDCG